MTEILQYAIRHIPTDWYLPRAQGRGGRGGSHVEPVPIDADHPYNEIRLFPYRINAERALIAWLKGTWDTHRSRGDGWTTDDDEYTEVNPVSWRRKEDMEIVGIAISIPSCIDQGAKPIKHLYGAAFMGNGVLFGYRSSSDEDKSNLNIPIAEQPHIIKVSRIVRRLSTDLFESQNSIYHIISWAGSQGHNTIPEEFK